MDAHVERTVADIRKLIEYHQDCLAAGQELLQKLWKVFELPLEELPAVGPLSEAMKLPLADARGSDGEKQQSTKVATKGKATKEKKAGPPTGGTTSGGGIAAVWAEVGGLPDGTEFSVDTLKSAPHVDRLSLIAALNYAAGTGRLRLVSKGRPHHPAVFTAGKNWDLTHHRGAESTEGRGGDKEVVGDRWVSSQGRVDEPSALQRQKLAELKVEKGVLEAQLRRVVDPAERDDLREEIQELEKEMEGMQ